MVKAFPGRVIIDHRPKTGGVAVEGWLAHKFGRGCVSTHLPGSHQDLIASYGGQYSIIIAHINFHPGEALDPRYQYVTWLRNPVDRVLSWLFYVLQDAPATNQNSKDIKSAAETFLRSEGRECPDHRFADYSNHYVHHFSRIDCPDVAKKTMEGRLDAALAAAGQYDIVGFYEDFPGFLSQMANLVGLDAPRQIGKANVSKVRPEISAAFRERIMELNEYDIRFYSKIAERKKDTGFVNSPASVLKSGDEWVSYNPDDVVINRPLGMLSIVSPLPSFTANQPTTLRACIENRSGVDWPATGHFPVNVSYHWLHPSGKTYLHDGRRTPLPGMALRAGESAAVDVLVDAPSEPGGYTLIMTLVQERCSWLERKGFEPAIIRVVVGEAATRRFDGWIGMIDRIKAMYGLAPVVSSDIRANARAAGSS